MNLKYLNLILSAILLFGVSSCEQEADLKMEVNPVAKTETGRKLIEGTNLFAYLNSDSTYTPVSGVQITEISFLGMTGYATRMFIAEVDLTNPNISVEASTPFNKPAFGRQAMTEQAKFEDATGHNVWAGINGDFFNLSTGVPQGILYKEGVELKSTFSDAVCTWFAITNTKKALIGDQDLYPEVKNTFAEAISGRVTLLKDGVILKQTDIRLEPRTAIGVSQDGNTIYMLVVDGRLFSYSSGMDYIQLAKCLKALGADDAINLDGGGSSTFFVRNILTVAGSRFDIRNWPSDNGGAERTVSNGLLIISNK